MQIGSYRPLYLFFKPPPFCMVILFFVSKLGRNFYVGRKILTIVYPPLPSVIPSISEELNRYLNTKDWVSYKDRENERKGERDIVSTPQL